MGEFKSRLPIVLSIAGSDNTGGAGIQADIKTCVSMNVYCCTAITAITAQNFKGLRRLEYVGNDMLMDQLETVYECIKPDAVKIGLLPNTQAIEIIAESLIRHKQKNIVLDPVLGTTTGGVFGDKPNEVIASMKAHLFPIADLITPNVPELERLGGDSCETTDLDDRITALASETELKSLLVKGGHNNTDICEDILFQAGKRTAVFSSPRIKSDHTHGTGCVLSTAIACGLAKGEPLTKSISRAKKLIIKAIENGRDYPVMPLYGPVQP